MKRTPIGCGSECKVYDIGNGVCYKRYRTKQNAKIAYQNAVKAADAGIAPDVFKQGKWGYTTEIVDTFEDMYPCKHCEESIECSELCNEFIETVGRKKYYEMTDIADEIFNGNATIDFHNDNIGLKGGKPVMIDFGVCSGLNL